ncbi:MAG: adenosylmethionine--8-amino-7-oxononanoate transaminase [Actinomycetota bacterium]
MTTTARLVGLDKAHVWHPFTQMKGWMDSDPLVIERGEGCELIDTEGRRYLDGVSSLWVNVHGHGVPEIDQAIRDQLGLIAHSTLLGLSNVPSIELAALLVELANPAPARDPLTKVFFSEAGACAVEVALKMAFGYWQKNSASNGAKRTFISLDNGYHGDTLGAVSVGGIDLFQAAYQPLLFESLKTLSPYCYRCPLGQTFPDCQIACLQPLEELLEARHQEVCAVIVEPLVQAAGGMITAPHGYLQRVRALCDQFDVLLIADEVATGVGRTGTFFACEQEGVVPDILVAGKGLTGGYLPLAVTMTNDRVFDAFLGEHEEFKTLFHGHTYTGNPLSCSAAIANLKLMQKRGTLNHVRNLEPVFEAALLPLRRHRRVGDIRRRGLMCGIEVVQNKDSRTPYEAAAMIGQRIARQARSGGVIIRTLGDVVVLMPPLAISAADLQRLVAETASAIDVITNAEAAEQSRGASVALPIN